MPRSLRRLGVANAPVAAACLALSLSWGYCGGARAQNVNAAGDSIDAIEKDFQAGIREVELKRLDRLAKLAATRTGTEANRIYEEYFKDAILAGLYDRAEPIAERVIRDSKSSGQVRYLAELVNLVAEVDRGDLDGSLKSLSAAYSFADQAEKNGDPVESPLPAATKVSLVDLYFQRLSEVGRFDIAQKAFVMIEKHAKDPAVKEFAASRLHRLAMLGKPAPAIAAKDLDGKPFSLAAHKGDVVLVVFWATWCVPNVRELDDFEKLFAKYQKQGLRIVGVNLNTSQEGPAGGAAAASLVRRFVLEHNVVWPIVLNGSGDQDFAKAYGITDIPANALIDRAGNLVHLDLTGPNLAKVIEKHLAGGRPAAASGAR